MDLPARSVRKDTIEDAGFLAGELAVEQHSAELRKELSLPNLVFTQVLSILGLSWIGTAGKLGASHLMFWLAAIALFYIPSAFVVIHLNNEMPLEGGLYQWAKLRFNELSDCHEINRTVSARIFYAGIDASRQSFGSKV